MVYLKARDPLLIRPVARLPSALRRHARNLAYPPEVNFQPLICSDSTRQPAASPLHTNVPRQKSYPQREHKCEWIDCREPCTGSFALGDFKRTFVGAKSMDYTFST